MNTRNGGERQQIDEAGLTVQLSRPVPFDNRAGLEALERELNKSPKCYPLDEIACLVRALTYGEMVELASEIAKHTGENPLNVDTLPGTLHRWSTGTQKQS
jgi:hypothetical protein